MDSNATLSLHSADIDVLRAALLAAEATIVALRAENTALKRTGRRYQARCNVLEQC